jgi:psp operon transcriptional activator
MVESGGSLRNRFSGKTPVGATDALGQSETFLEFQERLSRVAPINRPVLILGERGTGKELAASRLHYLSNRWQGAFVALNCAALASSLIESELFGYEKGAFTGAEQRRAGRFETADGGTLFLDEIGNIPLEVQEKILRVVEYSTFERVGGSQSVEVDVRIIAATNVDLKSLTARNLFKQDLLDRLSFEVLFLPPLRERQDDIMLLAHHFAGRMAVELGWDEIPRFSAAAVEAMQSYHWPGNVRELKNVVERAVYRADALVVSDIVFDPFHSPFQAHTAETQIEPTQPEPQAPAEPEPIDRPLKEAVWDLKVRLLENALKKCEYNQKKAAKRLGLTYHQFRGLYRQYQKKKSPAVDE